ncbi:xanthine dehydrogenase family protein molybdopterin-binding subunit [Roseomonas sp. USHLN139]|uniref:xanthine dehydrogenase family protein molybdopterin-binding subunit n=1 Tax=Roseomonas sp. USHLN139 TaxID=3081298 RepID=UPI003B02A679
MTPADADAASDLILRDPRSRRRLEDARFLRGEGGYLEDLPAEGALQAVFLRSPHAHARLGAIDAAAALRLPGVVAVITGAELLAAGVQPLPCAMSPEIVTGLVVPPRHALAVDRVRHVGEPVALVLADTLSVARDAAELVAVEYDPLPAVTDTAAALAPGAPLLFPEIPGNCAFHFRRGAPEPVAAAFAAAAHQASLTLVNNRVTAAPLENRGVLAWHDTATDRLRLVVSGQDVHGLRRDLAHCLGLPPARIQVTCPDVGGGFGMKNVLHPEYVALLWAARQLGRPLRWVAQRMEDFAAAAQGRDNVSSARLALDADGKFLALEVEIIGGLGAYVSALGPGAHTTAPMAAMGGVYAIPAVTLSSRGALTNTAPVDAYRGAGKPEANYIIERLIDVAALQLGLDRAELRARNFIDAFPYRSALGIPMDTARFPDNLATALAAADRAGFPARRAASAARGRLRGLGLACFLETSRGAPTEEGAIRILAGGRIGLLTGTQSNGQGLATSFAQIAARRLGLPEDSFTLLQADSDLLPRGGGHGGARSLPLAGTALVLALDVFLDKARALAATLLQAEPASLVFAGARFTSPDGATVALTRIIEEGGAAALDSDAHNPNDQIVFPNGCHLAEVEVDPETGEVFLQSYLAVDDYGTLVNPLLTAGQVQGGLAQGIGQALLEAIRYDPESGQLLSASLNDYCLPRAADLPWLEVRFNEHPTARNPLGVKGAGQAGCIGAPQTVVGAVADALGLAHLDMPLTPERVWRACQGRACQDRLT